MKLQIPRLAASSAHILGAVHLHSRRRYVFQLCEMLLVQFLIASKYLLNSHANVHSQNRPHYCSVKNCPRSEGGKGFKRKNEMIRHGLVHDSPGYVCPFCPDREHKYPRPDNLQRYLLSRSSYSSTDILVRFH